MKKWIAVILTLMLLLTACGGEDASPETTLQTEAPTYSNEGPEGILDDNLPTTVYKLTRATSYDEEGKEQWHREYIYDSNGFCIEDSEVASGVVTYRNTHTPNAQGLTAETQYTDATGGISVIKYEYDANGRMTYQGNYQDGVLTDYTQYTYDEMGNYLTLQQYYAGELVMDYSFAYTYDSQGYMLTREEYMGAVMMSQVAFEYDSQGREIASTSTVAGGASQSRTVSTWEGLTETREYYGSGDEAPYLVAVITYDDHGNVILEQSQYAGGDYALMEYAYEPFEVTK